MSSMLKLHIPVKPLSVNAAYRGRRFKTTEYEYFESDVSRLLRKGKYDQNDKSDVYVVYVFYISNYKRSDAANFEKVTSDVLVALNHFRDDCHIKANTQVKHECKSGEERIDAYICSDQKEYIEAINTGLK